MADNISFISTKSGQHSKQKRLRAHVDYDEMTVKYGRISLGVPIGFKACLENVTREVLREQPKDIPAFLACYFNQLNENQKKGISANNLVTERIVEVKAFEEQGVQKEEEKVETQEAGNLTDDCQVSNVQSQTEMPAPVPTADDNQLSFEQQQEIEHEGDENQQENEEDEQKIEDATEEVKAVCLEDILKQEEYKQNENAMSLEEQEKIDHQEETTAAAEEEENSDPSAENEAETEQNQPPKPVCLEQLLKEKEQSQIIEENSNPKKIESAPSTNQPEAKTDSNDNQAKATQSEPAVLNNSASEVPSHISLDALPDNIKLVEAIVKTSVTELAEEENAEKEGEVQEQEQEKEEQEQEEQKQEEPVDNTTEQKINPVQEEAVDDKNGDIEA